VSTSVTYESPTQINLTYSISAGATPGSSGLNVSTLFGSSSQSFTIYATGTSWIDTFGVSTDTDGNVVLTQDDFNSLVSQGLLPSAAGAAAIAITQPELYPVLTAGIVIVSAAYITYQLAQWIKAQNYDRLTLDYCRKRLVECIEIGYFQGRRMDCTACYGYCKNNSSQWPSWDCPTTP